MKTAISTGRELTEPTQGSEAESRRDAFTVADLLIALSRFPTLTSDGMGIVRVRHRCPLESAAMEYASRAELFDRVDMIGRLVDWLGRWPRRKTINPNMGSYALKHQAERELGEYCSNGELICAAGVGDRLVFERIALNIEQVRQYQPPENPAKSTDSRFAAYRDRHGDKSWELDALDPNVIAALITERVDHYRDDDRYAAQQVREETERDLLGRTSDRWADVVELVSTE